MRSKVKNNPRERLLSAAGAREFDRIAREVYGMSVLVLMENAGAAAAREAQRMRGSGRIVIVCGKGNNGGDGLVCCRHLLARGIVPRLFVLAPAASVKGEAGINLRILRSLGTEVIFLTREISALRGALKNAGLVVDALLGTGTRGELAGLYKEAIESVNAAGKRVLSLDIPSGLDADSGRIHGCCIKAHTTVTFVAPKRGMVKNQGPAMCGKVLTVDLGLPLAGMRV